MPYRVAPTEHPENDHFAVLYYLPWDEFASCEIFWSPDRAQAEAEAERRNRIEQLVEQKLDRVFTELTNQLKEEDPGKILDVIQSLSETWLVSKRN